jgi:ATP-dependent RNA helicase DHX8/PRP22
MGAEFPESLVASIDRLILTMHPKYKNKTAHGEEQDKDEGDDRDRKTRVFRGLAIPDRQVDYDVADQEMNGVDALDDTFAMLESLGGKAAGKPKDRASRKRSMSPIDDEDREISRNKRYRRSRSRSRSPRGRRDQRNEEFVFEDEFGRTRTVKRHEKQRSRRKYRDEDIDEFRRPPTPELDNEPVLYKVYDGTVTGVKQFGAFVNLKGVRGKVDGLVHISQIQEGVRVNDPNDLLSRGQQVKVKVLKLENGKISLSMKEVDQRSGHDLAPQARIGSGANMQALGGGDMVPVIGDGFNNRRNGIRKRMTSPERWEIKQLIASGVIPKSDYPDIDEDFNAHINSFRDRLKNLWSFHLFGSSKPPTVPSTAQRCKALRSHKSVVKQSSKRPRRRLRRRLPKLISVVNGTTQWRKRNNSRATYETPEKIKPQKQCLNGRRYHKERTLPLANVPT